MVALVGECWAKWGGSCLWGRGFAFLHLVDAALLQQSTHHGASSVVYLFSYPR